MIHENPIDQTIRDQKKHYIPLISIITVVYNDSFHLEKTIKSVISQTYKNIEYIIVDGESNDGTIDIIKKYDKNISLWVSEKDTGIYNAMNKGIKLAKGEYLCFMNSADTFFSKKTVENIFENKDYSFADIIYGSTYIYRNKKHYEIKPRKLESIIKGRMIFVHQSCFVRTEVLRQNPFNENYKVNADYNLFLQLFVKNYHFLYVNQPISIYDNNGFSQNAGLQGLKEKLAIHKTFKISRFSIYLLFLRFFIVNLIKKIFTFTNMKLLPCFQILFGHNYLFT